MSQPIHKVKDLEILSKIIDISELGVTHKARNTQTGSPYLITILDYKKTHQESQKNGGFDFVPELLSFKKLSNENLLNPKEVLTTENNIYVVFELASDKDVNLQTIVDSKGGFPEERLLPLLTDLLLGYLPFFKSKMLHRNILSKNVYYSNNRYKLLNFPLTKSVGTKACSSYFYYKNGVTPYEVLESYSKMALTNKVDIWALGSVLYEAVMGVVPFGGKNHEELLETLENAIKGKKAFLQYLPNPKGMSLRGDLKDLLEHMLQFYPDDRIDFDGVVKHPFIQKKKKELLFEINDYFKKMKYNFEHDLDFFKSLDSSFKKSLKTAFDLCELDPLKLNELDILEVLKVLPGEYGFSCEMAYRIILLETRCQDPYEKKLEPGDFPYQTRALSMKNIPCQKSLEESTPDMMESMIEEKKLSTPPKLLQKKDQFFPKNVEKKEVKAVPVKMVSFKDKMTHELEIFRFIEDIEPSLKQALDENEHLSQIFRFILGKYLFIRVEYFKTCLLREENIFQLESWSTQMMYLNLENWVDQLKKVSIRANQCMNSTFENLKVGQIKEKKLIPFLNFDCEVTSSEEKSYVRVFLKIALDIKAILEKNNQKMLSKFSYGVILKLFYFVSIYEQFGFFRTDMENKFNIMEMTQNVMNMDKEKMKKEIFEFLRTFLQKE